MTVSLERPLLDTGPARGRVTGPSRKSSVVALDELLNFTGEAYDLETELVLEGFRVRLARDVPFETMPVNQRVQTR